MKNNDKAQAMITKILGYESFYSELYPGSAMASVTSRLVIDNTSAKADEVIDRIIAFIDCMLRQIQDNEPDRITDYFTLVADGDRIQFDAFELALDGDEPEWNRWKAFRERFMNGRLLEAEHQFISEPNDEVFIEWSFPKLLKDLLEGGKLAEYVTLTAVLDNGDYADWHEFRKPYHQDIWKRRMREEYYPFNGQRFWMNGFFNNEYVCGEVPFVQDNAAVMSIESWYQSELVFIDADDHEGIVLTLAPNSKPDVIEKALALMKRFYNELPCTVEARTGSDAPVRFDRIREPLSREEELHLHMQMAEFFDGKKPVDPLVIQAQLDKEKADSQSAHQDNDTPTNEEAVQAYLALFAKIREYFDDKDVDALLSVNTNIQDLYTRHAFERYSEDDIKLYRFGLCVRMLLQGGADRQLRIEWGLTTPEQEDTVMGWPVYLYEKIRALPDTLKKAPKDKRNAEISLVGMNDLSAQDAYNTGLLYDDGLFIRIFDICLNNTKDINTLENLMNELSAFEAELQKAHKDPSGTQGAYDEQDERVSLFEASGYVYSPCELWKWMLPEGDPRRSTIAHSGKILTDREFQEYIFKTGYCLMETNCIMNDVLYFESMDMGTVARLRFRRENGQYFHEISMLD